MINFGLGMSELTHGSTAALVEQVGAHPVSVEGEVIHIRFRGPYLPAEARQLMALVGQVQREKGRAYLLIDLTHAGLPSLETRRVLAQAALTVKNAITVYYGVSFITRAMALLLHRMMGLVSKQEVQVFFASDENEGKRIIENCRGERPPAP
jgi:hypothetical protein